MTSAAAAEQHSPRWHEYGAEITVLVRSLFHDVHHVALMDTRELGDHIAATGTISASVWVIGNDGQPHSGSATTGNGIIEWHFPSARESAFALPDLRTIPDR